MIFFFQLTIAIPYSHMFITTSISPNCTLKATGGVECDSSFVVLWHTMETISHDLALFLDNNLLVQIERNSATPWVQWFNAHVNMGKNCFVTPIVAAEYGKPLPLGVVLLQSPHPRSQQIMDQAVEGMSIPKPSIPPSP